MKEHSSEFKENLLNIGREVDSIVTIGNTTLHDELYSANIVYDGGILKSVMKELDLESSVDIEKGTILNFKTGIKVDDTYEYLDYGDFVVYSSERQEDERNYKITCYDKMLYSMKDYEDVGVTYPISVRDYIKAICDKLELDFANEDEEFANYDKIILNEKYLNTDGDSLGYKYRDVLDELAQVTASTICINNKNELEIRYIEEIPTINNTATGMSIDLDDSIDHKIASVGINGRTSQDTTMLPSEYQQVEYIQSNGTNAYINTNIIPTANTKISIDFEYLGGNTAQWHPFYGVRETAPAWFCSFINKDNYKIAVVYSGTDTGGSSQTAIEVGKRYNLRNEKGTFYLNNVAQSSISVTGEVSGCTRPMYLFGFNNNGNADTRSLQLKIYRCRFYEEYTPIRDFVPCYRKSDNVIGLYDVVNDVFYTNQNTSASSIFIKGNDITLPNSDFEQKVKVTTGTQEIKTSNKNLLEIKEGEFTYSNYINWKVENGLVYLSVNNIEEQGGALNLISGSTSRWASGTIKDYKITSNGGSYTFSIYKNGTITKATSGNVMLYIYKYKDDGSYSYSYFSININDRGNNTITLQDDEHIGDIILYSQYVECENVEFKMQLEKGSRAAEYIQHQGKRRNIHFSSRNLCYTNSSEWAIGHWNLTGIWDATNTRAGISRLIPVPENTTLYVTTNAQNYNFVLRGYDKNGDFVVSYGGKANGTTIQTIYNGIKIAYLGIAIYKWTGETSTSGQEILSKITSGEIKPFICLNSETDKTYDDYWNYELAEIGTLKDRLKQSKKINLYDPSYRTSSNTITCAHGTCTETNGVFSMTATGSDAYVWSIWAQSGKAYTDARGKLYEIKEDSYTITITNPLFKKNYIEFYDENKISLNFINFNNSNIKTFSRSDSNVPSNAKYFVIRFGVGDSVSDTTYETRVQLEAGTTASEYEPYNSDWYIEKNISITNFDGSFGTPNLNTNYANTLLIFYQHTLPYKVRAEMGLCNRLQYKTMWKTDVEGFYFDNNNTNVIMRINKSQVGTTLNTLNTWLATHNVKVYGRLTEPLYELITNEQLIAELNDLKQMLTYEGKTLIDITGDLAGNLNIEYATGYEDSYIVDERQLKDVNVDFGEKYGPINSIVLSRGGADNVYLQDEESTAINGLHEIKITDNQIMNGNDRDEYLPDILEKLDGLEYYTNDFTSPGICYLDLCDRYKVQAHGNEFDCVLFNDEINIDQGIEENIHTELPEEAQTDYSKADKTDRRINQTTFVVDKHEQQIQSLITQVGDRSDKQTSITQDIDKIELAVEDLEDLTFEVEGTNPITLEECVAGELLTLRIKGNNTVFDSLKPSNTLVPSDTLYPYGDSILILKHYTENEQHEIVETIERIDLKITQPLRYMSASVFDEFRYDYDAEQKAKVIRRIGLTNNGEMYQLQQEVIEPVDIDDIILTQGTNIIDIGAPYQANVYADYVKQNQFTKIFTTQYQVSTQILQLANQISLIVSEKVGKDEIVAEINLAVEDEQGIIDIHGNQIKIKSDYFELTADGKIKATSGLIGNLNLYTNSFGAWLNKTFQNEDESIKYQSGLFIPDKPDYLSSPFLYSGLDMNGSSTGISNANAYMTHEGKMYAKWFDVNGESGYFRIKYDNGGEAIRLTQNGLWWRISNENNNNYFGITKGSPYMDFQFFDAYGLMFWDALHQKQMGYWAKYTPEGTDSSKYGNIFVINSTVYVSGNRQADNLNYTIYVQGYEVQTSASDKRLKENIKDSTDNALDKIEKINIRQFDWRTDKHLRQGGKHINNGFIAQEVQKIDETLVNYDEEFDTYQMNDLNLIALNSKAIQELKAIVDKQQEEIDYLKEEIKKLKGEK